MTDLNKARNIYAHRLNLFAQFEQNCMFQYEGLIFDSRCVNQFWIAGEQAQVMLDRANCPYLVKKEKVEEFHRLATNTLRTALSKYYLAFIQ